MKTDLLESVKLDMIQNDINRLKSFSSVVNAIANGAEDSDKSILVDSLYYIDESLEDMVSSLRWSFEQIDSESPSEETEPNYDFTGVDAAIKIWANR